VLAVRFKLQQQCTLAGGDDYELCFTAPAARHADVLAAGAASGTPVHRIGRIDAEPGLRVIDATVRCCKPLEVLRPLRRMNARNAGGRKRRQDRDRKPPGLSSNP
jgi:hypothetical protein